MHLSLHYLSLVCIIAIIFLSGCNEPFQPLEENDKYFYSVYGYLDASADTQWVRIMPVRETTNYSDEPIDAIVTLTDLDTGQETVMNDSLFRLPQVAPGDALVWNFWTTYDITPSNDYKLTVERSDGATTTTTVNIPDDYPEPVVDGRYVTVTGVEHIAEARLDWKVLDKRDNTIHEFAITHTHRLVYYNNSNKYLLRISPNDDFANEILQTLDAIQPQIEILETNVVIIVAGDDWINFSELDREVIALPKETSNIENGVGYLVGTVIKTVPFPVCVGDFGEIIECYP
ncbi:MAG: DUF4249 family protein [Gracilimonas sp.]|uniref:hypothetical protein n=1 Tax=Gracilimonas sp. TaxID=1974203 RepID=UPI0019A12F59|nr:hypothetical protein [Gracilimonas sp.]MBD3617375.1 DUF4249 family protein [Gracilimonas sp.]